MRILLTSSPRAQADRARAILESAGHEVLACVDQTTPFPCRGGEGGRCPLDDGVTVAVSAPGRVPPVPMANDIGVVCVARRHIPLVVAGPDHFGAWLEGVVSPVELAAAVEAAARAPLPRHTAAVEAELRHAGVTGRASVVRTDRGLRVTLDLPEDTDTATVERLAVRAQGAVRAIDPWAPGVDVVRGPIDR